MVLIFGGLEMRGSGRHRRSSANSSGQVGLGYLIVALISARRAGVFAVLMCFGDRPADAWRNAISRAVYFLDSAQ